MKKIILITFVTLASITMMGQSSLNSNLTTTVLDTFDLNTLSADTSIYYVAPKGSWGVTAVWTDVTGTDTLYVYLSNDDDVTNTFEYDVYNTFQFPITGSTGSNSVAGNEPELGFIIFYVPKMVAKLTFKVHVN
jgi:hypothetical protein